MHRIAPLFFALISALLPALPGTAAAADPDRGKALYETRCSACHNTSVHQSTSRKATSFEGIRMQVTRWTRELGGSWDDGDIDNISVYLNDLYYRLPCPAQSCPARTSSLSSVLPLLR